MLNLLNPFSKRDKPDTTFIDRVGIAVLALFCVAFTILLPIYAIDWFLRASWKGRVKLILILGFIILFGERAAIYLLWILEEGKPLQQFFAYVVYAYILYWFCVFLKGFYRWFITRIGGSGGNQREAGAGVGNS